MALQLVLVLAELQRLLDERICGGSFSSSCLSNRRGQRAIEVTGEWLQMQIFLLPLDQKQMLEVGSARDAASRGGGEDVVASSILLPEL